MTNPTQPEVEALARAKPYRSQCPCACHHSGGRMIHIAPCCVPDPVKIDAPQVDDGVTQEDRDAAGDCLFPATHGDIPAVEEWHRIVTGADDGHRLVQAFRRHRLASANPARVEALEAETARLKSALSRQADNMAFTLNKATLPDQWYAKFSRELAQDRESLAGKDAS